MIKYSQPWNDVTAVAIMLRMKGGIMDIFHEDGSIVFYDNQITITKESGDLYAMYQKSYLICVSFDINEIVESGIMIAKIL